ncbi:CGNR zinc finger domain-containing protein [Pseudonocardia sp. TRM90224]|uniref:CGNR zinc finger domain-containing protein n=1 Tax=Pseudonocardia sp. TRM90224 TaxID=2812678 RepID=UPI001E3F638C|nr:ABATE domain-containing protein [Pseudonocardia sp. TRM90224]
MATDPVPTASSMRLDGGHPALDLVNTVHAEVDGTVVHDVLRTPQDVVVLAHRLGLVAADHPTGEAALADARSLRDALTDVLTDIAPDAVAVVQQHHRAAMNAARLVRSGDVFEHRWAADEHTPVHRWAVAAVDLLTGPDLTRVHRCDGCNWLFVDRSRGTGRRWCSMVDCGTTAKKRRYVQRRRERRGGRGNPDV